MRVFRFLAPFAVFAVLLGVSFAADAQEGSQGNGKAALPADAVRVQPVQIVDPNGFGRPMAAGHMMIPVGWQIQGGIVWNQNVSGCGPINPHINWGAFAPDGVTAVMILPEERWTGFRMQMMAGAQQGPCPNVIIGDPQQFILQYVQRVRQGAQILDFRPRNDMAQKIMQQLPAPPADVYGVQTRQQIVAGDALVGYEMQGVQVRELVGVIAFFGITRMSDGMGGVTESHVTVTLPTFVYRAPNGQLDFNRAAMIRNSYQADPQWSQLMAQHRLKMAQIANKGAMERSRIISQTNREISEMQMDSWRKQQESNDRNAREFNEYIRDVETYADPSGGTVQLDSTYDNAWRLDDGTYVLTNDPSFNPYAATGQSGQRMERAR